MARQQNETSNNVQLIYNKLLDAGAVNMFRFIINPDSFAQTVENMFYLSFLIRDGKVSIENETGEPILGMCFGFCLHSDAAGDSRVQYRLLIYRMR